MSLAVFWLMIVLVFSLESFAEQYAGEEILKLKKEEKEIKLKLQERFKTIKSLSPKVEKALQDFKKCIRTTGYEEYCKDKAFNDIADQVILLYESVEDSEKLLERLLTIYEKMAAKEGRVPHSRIQEFAYYGESLKRYYLALRDLLPPEIRSLVSHQLSRLHRELSLRKNFFPQSRHQTYKLLDTFISIKAFKISLQGIVQRLLVHGLETPELSSPEAYHLIDGLGNTIERIFGKPEEEEYHEEDVESLDFNALKR